MHKSIVICAERYFSILNSRMKVVNHLLNSGYEITIIATRDPTKALRAKNGIRLIALESWVSFEAFSKIKNLIIHNNINTFIVFNTKPLIICGLILKFVNILTFKKIGVFTGLGALGNLKGQINLFYGFLLKFTRYSYDSYVFQNRDDLQLISKFLKLSKDEINFILSSGVDLKRFNPNKNRKVKSKSKIIIMIGRAISKKGVAEFCSIAKLFKKNENFIFKWIGEIPKKNRKNILNKFLTNNVSHLEFSNKIENIYSESTMLLFTSSYREGVPRVVIEAMAMKLPIISYKTPGVTDVIIHDKTGILVENLDPESLKNKILDITNNQNKIDTLTENAFQWVNKNVCIDKISKEYLDLIRN